MSEQQQLRIVKSQSFFSKFTSNLGKLFIYKNGGQYSWVLSHRRNLVLKTFNNFVASTGDIPEYKRQQIISKYEGASQGYLEILNKYVIDTLYKKVQKDTASPFEATVLKEYYEIEYLKENEYIEYKHMKQKFLLELDLGYAISTGKQSLINSYKKFYIYKMDSLYKGLLKHYSIQLTDSRHTRNEVYDKIFKIIEDYIQKILPIKISLESTDKHKEILEEYNKVVNMKYDATDLKKTIEKNMIILGLSRHLFTHSLPLIVAEKCYIKLLKDTRKYIIVAEKFSEKEDLYKMFITLIEDYNIKLLSNKIYWEKPEQRNEYKEFWDKYKEILNYKEEDYKKYQMQKEILFIRYDMKLLDRSRNDYEPIKEFYRIKLKELGDMRTFKNKVASMEGRWHKKNV